jgi:hypothetical protein
MYRFQSIHQAITKIKAFSAYIDRRDVYAIAAALFMALSGFFVGRIASIESSKQPITVTEGDSRAAAIVPIKPIPGLKIRTR